MYCNNKRHVGNVSPQRTTNHTLTRTHTHAAAWRYGSLPVYVRMCGKKVYVQ